MLRNHNMLGVTLIELMVVMTIIVILSTLAYPSYLEYVRKSRRIDAMNSLLLYQIAQEKYRSHHVQYAADFTELIGHSDATIRSADDYYLLSISESNPSFYRILAVARGGQAADAACAVFAITPNGPDFSGDYANERCWNH